MTAPEPQLVLEIGEERSKVTLAAGQKAVASRSVACGAGDLDASIVDYVKREYHVMIGQQTAEALRAEIGSAAPLDEEVQAEIRGRELASGLPKTLVVTSEEIRLALEEPLAVIVGALRGLLDDLAPKIRADALGHPPLIAGLAPALRGLPTRLSRDLGFPE